MVIPKRILPITLLFFLILFQFINNLFWIPRDDFSRGDDVIWHLDGQSTFYNGFRDVTRSQDTLINKSKGFLALFEADKRPWPKLVYFPSSISNMIWGRSTMATVIPNIIYYIILLFSLYNIGKIIGNRGTGMLACFLISFYPELFGLSMKYGLDFPLCGMVALCIYLLICSEGLKNRKYSLWLALYMGLGVLVKFQILIFMAIPLLWEFFKTIIVLHKDKKRERSELSHVLINLTLVVITVLFCFSIWWRGEFMPYWKFEQSFTVVNQIKWLVGFGLKIIEGTSFPLFLVFIIGLSFVLKHKFPHKSLIILWIVVPWLVLSFFAGKVLTDSQATESFFPILHPKFARYYLPSLPALALVSAFWIMHVLKGRARKILVLSIGIYAFTQFFYLSWAMDKFPALIIDYPYREINIFSTSLQNESCHSPRISTCKEATQRFTNVIRRIRGVANDELRVLFIRAGVQDMDRKSECHAMFYWMKGDFKNFSERPYIINGLKNLPYYVNKLSPEVDFYVFYGVPAKGEAVYRGSSYKIRDDKIILDYDFRYNDKEMKGSYEFLILDKYLLASDIYVILCKLKNGETSGKLE